MLNNEGMRELCYSVKVDEIKPIEGRDRVECAVVGGWTIMVRKDQFKPGDIGIYFEIDSQVPEKPEFEFLAAKHYKIKTQKYKTPVGQFWSQGLLMGIEDFPQGTFDGYDMTVEHTFLTKVLEVKYADPDDNARKAKSSGDKYKRMAQRMGKKCTKQPYKWLLQREWGKKLLFLFFGKKKDSRSWPSWVIKTDEERVQNIPWVLEDKSEWYATEKIDGSSSTYTMKGWGRKREFYICSRNVCFDTPEKMEKGAYYDTNIYQEMAIKYDMQHVLDCLMVHFENTEGKIDFITIQGEVYGEGVQKRDYGMKERDLAVFNLIVGYQDGTTRRCNPREMTDILHDYNVPCVPIVDESFVLPDTIDELLTIATDKSKVDGGMREGLVFRSKDGSRSFKAVSNEFLMKYHS